MLHEHAAEILQILRIGKHGCFSGRLPEFLQRDEDGVAPDQGTHTQRGA
jgi:hypothetical protein